MRLSRILFSILLLPAAAFSECLTGLTVTNDSKYPVEVRVNGIPVAVLEPGQSINDKPYLISGTNAVKVKPLTQKGEIATKVKGPKDTKFVPSCNDGSSSTIIYENKHFVKVSAGRGHGHGPSTPVKPKPVGNAKGRKLSLTGRWISIQEGSGNCTMDILDGDDIGKDDQLNATVVCDTSSGFFEGSKIGGKATFVGLGQSRGLVALLGLDLAIFSNILVEYEGEKVKLDALVGKLYAPPDTRGVRAKFVRLSAD